jgi:DNA-directed RNA polymerase subunit RPC12/RpoP
MDAVCLALFILLLIIWVVWKILKTIYRLLTEPDKVMDDLAHIWQGRCPKCGKKRMKKVNKEKTGRTKPGGTAPVSGTPTDPDSPHHMTLPGTTEYEITYKCSNCGHTRSETKWEIG